jgi:hypothetical protein
MEKGFLSNLLSFILMVIGAIIVLAFPGCIFDVSIERMLTLWLSLDSLYFRLDYLRFQVRDDGRSNSFRWFHELACN